MKSGLEDVIAAETQLSDVDGAAGRLVIRGVSLDDLVATSRYEDVAALLLDGMFDEHADAAAIKTRLGAARVELFAHVKAVDSGLLSLSPVEAVRALLARIEDGDDFATAIKLMAAQAVFLPAVLRLQRGETAVAPDAS